MTNTARQARSIRYHVIVADAEGQEYVASAFAQWEQALKRARIIAETWNSALNVSVVDTFGERSRLTFK